VYYFGPMIVLSVGFCVRMICVRMIFLGVWFFLSVLFVCLWFFCMYDLHDDAPVPVAYRKNSYKWTLYSDFLNFGLWKHRTLLLPLTFTWGFTRLIGWTRVRNWTLSTRSYMHSRAIFQSIHGRSSFTPVYIVDLTPPRHVLTTRIT